MKRLTAYTITLWACLTLLAATLFLTVKAADAYQKDNANTTQAKRGFTLPQIPATLTDAQARADYLLEHYWANFDFRDTTLISRPEITEQALADFLNILLLVPHEQAAAAAVAMMNSASADATMFRHFIELADKYLYDPNSPYRNEELYIPVLQYIVSSPRLNDIDKIRPQCQLELALKNRVGETAVDFTYTLSDGYTGRMHALRADYTILFFNNPDCHDCQRVKEYMAASSVMNRLGEVKKERARLAILAVYPDGDIPLWRQAEYPRGIINSYDAGQVITAKQLYDLKAIPTLYLLDKDKRVLLKDGTIEEIEYYLQNRK